MIILFLVGIIAVIAFDVIIYLCLALLVERVRQLEHMTDAIVSRLSGTYDIWEKDGDIV